MRRKRALQSRVPWSAFGPRPAPGLSRSAALVPVADVVNWAIRHAFCDLGDLADDWGLLNHQTGGSHDREASKPAAPADDGRHAYPGHGRQSPEGSHTGDQGFR